MASMGFSFAQIHVIQEKVRRRISEEAATRTTTNKLTTEEENKNDKSFMAEEEKAVCNSWTAGRVHPCVSSTAATAPPPTGGHR
jgi:hypothetical protein